MLVKIKKKELIIFENEIAELFNSGKIRAPIHLYSNNEDILINFFRKVKNKDWIFCSWRSHYQCLLKGVPEEKLLSDIKKGRSISLCYPEYKIFSSAIVTGIIPIAAGVAFDIKRKSLTDHVYCFVGDMTSETGSFEECYKYVKNHDLPVRFIIEDNGKSVCTDTKKTWNTTRLTYEGIVNRYMYYYKYETKWPHAGAGKRVQF